MPWRPIVFSGRPRHRGTHVLSIAKDIKSNVPLPWTTLGNSAHPRSQVDLPYTLHRLCYSLNQRPYLERLFEPQLALDLKWNSCILSIANDILSRRAHAFNAYWGSISPQTSSETPICYPSLKIISQGGPLALKVYLVLSSPKISSRTHMHYLSLKIFSQGEPVALMYIGI